MTEIKVEIKGLAELIKKLGNLSDINLNPAVYAGAIKLSELSQRVSPVDTGLMKASHSAEQTEDGADVVVSTDYAIAVHEGTKYKYARRWITNTIDNNQPEILRVIKAAAEDIIANEAQ